MSTVYGISIVWDKKRDCFVATCHELPELEATGSYRAEAVLGIEQAIVNWHMEHEENPPRAPPKTAHELDARFDDGEGTTLLGFGK